MPRKLKVDFHTHTAQDPYDYIFYSAHELVDRAVDLGFDALAITNHNTVLEDPSLAAYAEQKGILLLPGMEVTLADRHVLVINPVWTKNTSGRPLEDLSRMTNQNSLIIAPHPFFPRFKSLHEELHTILDHVDAIELSSCYNRFINYNRKAIRVAEKSSKPMVGASDCHLLWQLGTTYSWVEAEKDLLSIIQAVKKGKVEVATRPLPSWKIAVIWLNFVLRKVFLGHKQGF